MLLNTLTRTASPKTLFSPSIYFCGAKRTQLMGGLAVVLFLSLLSNGEAKAASFSFTKIADINSPTNLSDSYLSTTFGRTFSDPTINDSGIVAFSASLNYQGPLVDALIRNNPGWAFGFGGVFTGDGETITPISDSLIKRMRNLGLSGFGVYLISNPLPIPNYYLPLANFDTNTAPSINNDGIVAFYGRPIDSNYPPNISASIGISNGSNISQWSGAVSCSPGLLLGQLAINDSGHVVYGSYHPYRGCMSNSVAVGGLREQRPAPLLGYQGKAFYNLSAASLNNGGTAAFAASFSDVVLYQANPGDIQTQGIFTRDRFTRNTGNTIKIADNSGLFNDFNFSGLDEKVPPERNNPFLNPIRPIEPTPIINNNDAVAFFANLKAGGKGIFAGNGDDTITIVDSSDRLSNFGNFDFNDAGNLAFLADGPSENPSSFLGANAAIDRIIGIGDSLLGSTVTSLKFSNQGLNNSGQIAFWASLANGTSGIFRANPIAQSSSEFVPAATQTQSPTTTAIFLAKPNSQLKPRRVPEPSPQPSPDSSPTPSPTASAPPSPEPLPIPSPTASLQPTPPAPTGKSIPEPTSAISLLALGVWGAGAALKRQKKQPVQG